MVEMTLRVPQTLIQLPESERGKRIRAGLQEAARARIRQLQADIAASKEELARFEARYGMSFSRFEVELLTQQDSLQIHEDYNDWFYWQSVLEEKQRLLADLQVIGLHLVARFFRGGTMRHIILRLYLIRIIFISRALLNPRRCSR